MGGLVYIREEYKLSESQRMTLEFAHSDLADLNEARENPDKEELYLLIYREMMAQNPCPDSDAGA